MLSYYCQFLYCSVIGLGHAWLVIIEVHLEALIIETVLFLIHIYPNYLLNKDDTGHDLVKEIMCLNHLFNKDVRLFNIFAHHQFTGQMLTCYLFTWTDKIITYFNFLWFQQTWTHLCTWLDVASNSSQIYHPFHINPMLS